MKSLARTMIIGVMVLSLLSLLACANATRGQKGAAHAYNIKSHREEERRWVEQAETACARFVTGWNPRGPKKVRTGAATEVRP